MRKTMLIGALLGLAGARADAQKPLNPAVSLDGQVGAVWHPGHHGETWYKTSSIPWGRVSLAVGPRSKGTFRPSGIVEYGGMMRPDGDNADCAFAPNGSCRERFPDYSGFGLGVDVRWDIGRYLTGGAAVGVSFYDKPAYHGQVELGGRIGRPFRWVVSLRHAELHRLAGERNWLRTFTVGLRLQ
ncbi:MAG: hypothetical protein HOP28_04585 [Gemmatimonadales bacterium]|nr:hypothetical protein [Gemmatimonadales bacterium]